MAAQQVWGDDHHLMAHVEIGKTQQEILKRHWPHVRIFDDVRKTNTIVSGITRPVDVITGGDPCPCRSRARSNGKSRHPDLSGYFLALVGFLRPRWVVRENVLAPDDKDFVAALGMLGYRVLVVRGDSATYTGQQRIRDFIVGCAQASGESFQAFFMHFPDGPGSHSAVCGSRQVVPCLTTRRNRYDSRDCYIFEGGDRLRILDADERTSFAGFPPGWLDGLTESASALLAGNAVVPAVAAEIFKAIKMVS